MDWQAVDSCAVSDALDRFGHPGLVQGIVPLVRTDRVVGRAVTVELGPASDAVPTRHLGTGAVEAAAPGDVIVVAHRGRMDCAGWGGILSRAAHQVGVGGVVVDGACRDVGEAEAMGFPVFGRGPTPRTARGRVVELSYQRDVVVGDVVVRPGDLVVADSSGVVVVSQAWEEPVMTAALEITRREAAMVAAVEAGTPVSQVMGAGYERMTLANRGGEE